MMVLLALLVAGKVHEFFLTKILFMPVIGTGAYIHHILRARVAMIATGSLTKMFVLVSALTSILAQYLHMNFLAVKAVYV